MWAKGYNNKQMAKELGVTTRTINTRKSAIRKEVADMLVEDPMPNILLDISMHLNAAQAEYWEMYENAELDSNKIQALNGLTKLFCEKIKLLQSLGVIKKEAEEFKLTGQMTVDGDVFKNAFSKYIERNSNKT